MTTERTGKKFIWFYVETGGNGTFRIEVKRNEAILFEFQIDLETWTKAIFFSDKLYGTIISLSEMITTCCEIFGKIIFFGFFLLADVIRIEAKSESKYIQWIKY
jgi:hypothetical protein